MQLWQLKALRAAQEAAEGVAALAIAAVAAGPAAEAGAAADADHAAGAAGCALVGGLTEEQAVRVAGMDASPNYETSGPCLPGQDGWLPDALLPTVRAIADGDLTGPALS